MHGCLFVLLSLLVAGALPAQTHPGLVYATVNQQPLALDLWLPSGNGPHPVIVWIHSGGFQKNDRSEALTDAPALVARGFAVASIDYRLSNVAVWPAQIHDCKAAVRYLRGNATRYGLDPDRVAAFGFSAGAVLAAQLATTGGVRTHEGQVGGYFDLSSRVQCAAAFATASDLFAESRYFGPTTWASLVIGKPIGDIHQNRALPAWQPWVDSVASFDAGRYASSDDPALFLVHGNADTVIPVEQGRLLHKDLQAAGVATTLLEVAANHHDIPQSAYDARTQFFVAQLLQEPGYRSFGRSCGDPAADEPGIGILGTPRRGGTWTHTLHAAPPLAVALFVAGTARHDVDLAPFGAPGCSSYLADMPLVLPLLCDANGSSAVPLAWPSTAHKGASFYLQWVLLDARANTLGLAFSNAAHVVPQ